ncbi:uncharacterized protein V6R79_000950 [Siganus canaliculatus]
MSSSLLLSQHPAYKNPTSPPIARHLFSSLKTPQNVEFLESGRDEESRTAAPFRGEHKQSEGLPGSG